MKISQSLLKDVLNGCCKHYFKIRYIDRTKTEPTKAMFDGLYFESELLGTARDGKVEYPLLKTGKISKAQQDVDTIVDIARKVLENSNIIIDNVQKKIENDTLEGHTDFISDKIYDVKFTGETFDRWNRSFQYELYDTMGIQARHYQTIMHDKGQDFDVAFLVFSSHGWFRYILFPFEIEAIEKHHEKIEHAREMMDNLEEPTCVKCSECRFNDICNHRVMKFEIEDINDLILV